MQTITRHGGGAHFVRPDRVYRTSVLAPTIGYDPTADAQGVAASFTQYPADLPLPGLGGLRGLGLMAKLRMKLAAWKQRRALQGLRGAPRFTPAVNPQTMEAMATRLMNGG
jgi:hypothetical protein